MPWVAGIFILTFCCLASYFIASGLWKGLVATVSSIIAQGPSRHYLSNPHRISLMVLFNPAGCFHNIYSDCDFCHQLLSSRF